MTTALDGATLIEPAHRPPPAGRHALDADGFPTAKDERWRDTPIRDVLARLQSTTTGEPAALTLENVDALAGRHGAVRLVFVDGRFIAELSDRSDVAGLWCGPASAVPDEFALQLESMRQHAAALEPADGFSDLNRTSCHDEAVIISRPGAAVAETVHIVDLQISDNQRSQPRALVSVGADSVMEVVESFVGTGEQGFTNAVTFAAVGRGASLTHQHVQREPITSVNLARTIFEQDAHSEVSTTSLTLGADICRHAIDIVQIGEHATTTINGLYVPTGRQRHDTSITVDHAASHGVSTQTVSGVIDDHASGSFTGHVVVRENTIANNARQSNRNLVMTSTAQANTRPWLEIFADDVQCTHGATVGRLDAEALFYLRSRGIELNLARAMLVEAFIAEIVDKVTPASLHDEVEANLAERREAIRS